MVSDQQRGLLGQSLPAGGFKPEVVLANGVPDRLLSAHQSLVGAIEGVFGSGGDTPTDQALNSTVGLVRIAPGLGHCSRIESRPAVAVVQRRCARERAVELRSCARGRTVEL